MSETASGAMKWIIKLSPGVWRTEYRYYYRRGTTFEEFEKAFRLFKEGCAGE